MVHMGLFEHGVSTNLMVNHYIYISRYVITFITIFPFKTYKVLRTIPCSDTSTLLRRQNSKISQEDDDEPFETEVW
jgi:hypothetical protein